MRWFGTRRTAAPRLPLSTLLLAASALLASVPAAHAQELLIDDPLVGSTVGTQIGPGDFVAGGGFRSSGGKIVFDAGRDIRDGYFEAKMRGFTAPAQGINKSHPLAGWEIPDQYSHHTQSGSFWNWRMGTNYDAFKLLAAPTTIDTREEALAGSSGAVNSAPQHTYRVEWRNGTVTFRFDGQVLRSFDFPRFEQRYFTIGKDDQYGITSPAPIIFDVKVVDLGTGCEVPAPPTNLREISPTFDASVSIAWNPPTSGPAPDRYVIEAGTAPGRADLGSGTVAANVTRLDIPSMPVDDYWFRVRSKTTECGESDASNELAVTVVCGSNAGGSNAVLSLAVLVPWFALRRFRRRRGAGRRGAGR